MALCVARFSQVHTVNLTASNITDDQFGLLLRCSPKLRQLDISSTPISDKGALMIPQCCPLLQRLSFRMNVAISDVRLRLPA